ncbi:hypothetical protein V7S43_013794 [Phytophthora oleae]|uniref:Uncharacterized protein n=1 Tax=Phytophthora oleae TaxID=2107226 RepID=A0ABD3F2Z7_9STRA
MRKTRYCWASGVAESGQVDTKSWVAPGVNRLVFVELKPGKRVVGYPWPVGRLSLCI